MTGLGGQIRRMATVAFALVLSVTGAQATSLTLVTEDYPPYAYRENGVLKGTSVEQVELIMRGAGMTYRVEMMPWARALTLAETEANYCVFTTAHNSEREHRFKWVEPILSGRTLLIRKAGAAVTAATPEAATHYTVGATRGDFTAGLLTEKGFRKIDLAADFNLTLKKLMAGRVDMMPIAEDYYVKLRRQGAEIEKVLVLSEQIFSIACNLSVSDADVARMQAALTDLVRDGTQAAIFRRYGLEFDTQ
jgi:polar amino acid transport system substrate-binding protein